MRLLTSNTASQLHADTRESHARLCGSSFLPRRVDFKCKTSLFYDYFENDDVGQRRPTLGEYLFESARQQQRYFHSSRVDVQEDERIGYLFWEELTGGEGVFSVGLIGGEQGSIHRLHAGRAGEGPHEPVIYTVHVVDVHTRQEPDGVAVYEVQHADHTLSDLLL